MVCGPVGMVSRLRVLQFASAEVAVAQGIASSPIRGIVQMLEMVRGIVLRI